MFKRTETLTIDEFLHGKPEVTIDKRLYPLALAPLPLAMLSTPGGVAAETTKETIRHAFDPLIQMITTVSYPVAAVMITGSALMIMLGMKEKGYATIFSAATGFILVQLSPMLLDILFGIGSSLA